MYKKFRKWGMSQLTTCRLPPPPSKVAIMGFCSKRVDQCSILLLFFYRPIFFSMKKITFRFLVFEIWLLILESSQKSNRNCQKKCIVPKIAQCSETNAEPILRFLRFLVFEIWSILYSKFLVNYGLGPCLK